jgi:hypothetical protein
MPQGLWFEVCLKVFFAFMMVGAVMTMAGYSVLAERKVSAWMQGRVGPNRTVLPFVEYIPHFRTASAKTWNVSTASRWIEVSFQGGDRAGPC